LTDVIIIGLSGLILFGFYLVIFGGATPLKEKIKTVIKNNKTLTFWSEVLKNA